MRPAAGGDRDERRPGQERSEQPGRDAGLQPVRMAAQRVMVQRQVTGKPGPPGHGWRLVVHHASDMGV